MISRVFENLGRRGPAKATMLLAVVFFLSVFAIDSFAQKRFARVYPAGQDIRLVLINQSGTVTVEGWNRQEVSINASMEAPAANIAPSFR